MTDLTTDPPAPDAAREERDSYARAVLGIELLPARDHLLDLAADPLGALGFTTTTTEETPDV